MSNSIQVVAKQKDCRLSTAKRKIRRGHLWIMKHARKRGKYDFAHYCRKRYDALK